MKTRKKILAFAVSALTLAGVGSVAPVAFANNTGGFNFGPKPPADGGQSDPLDTQITLAPGNIDTAQKGSIIIHKLQNPDDGKAGDGEAKNDVANKAVPGVTFTYAKVENIDLTQKPGWKAVNGLQVDATGTVKSADGATTYQVAAETTATPTDNQGMTTISNLDLGVYLIKETVAPANVAKKSAPFLVTVPFPSKTSGWLYNVNVYPKNTVLNPEDKPVKTVKDADAIHFPGDSITWVIEQTVPTLGTKDSFTQFDIEDQLPAGVDKVTNANVSVEVLRSDAAVPNVEPVISIDDDNKVTVSFANSLDQLKGGDKIKVEITAKISANISGSLANQSHSKIKVGDGPVTDFPSSPVPGAEGDDPDKETPRTETQFAPLTITKVNKDQQKLNSAVFNIVPVEDDQCPAVDNTKGRNITTGSKPGHTEKADGVAALMVVPGKYCITETEAPLGYEIDPEWANGKVVEVMPTTGHAETITNLRVNDEGGSALPSLPLTGAAGFILLTFAGVAIVATAVGTGFVAVGRKKREQDA